MAYFASSPLPIKTSSEYIVDLLYSPERLGTSIFRLRRWRIMSLVTNYGKLWPRNDHSFEALERRRKLTGVYVVYDGSVPVYVGKGTILTRLEGHRKSRTRRDFWDYFSWFEVRDSELRHDAEALLLKTLPYYLRLLNKQQANFPNVRGIKLENKAPEVFVNPRFVRISRRAKGKKRQSPGIIPSPLSPCLCVAHSTSDPPPSPQNRHPRLCLSQH